MSEDYQIVSLDHPAWDPIGPALHRYNLQQAGEDHGQSLCFVLQSAGGEIAGGVIGATHWGWFHLDLMWVQEDLRGHGYGHRLLTLAEEEARRRGATNVYLDTFTFQAPGFYQKRGYRVFGELPDFPPGHRRYYMTKQL